MLNVKKQLKNSKYIFEILNFEQFKFLQLILFDLQQKSKMVLYNIIIFTWKEDIYNFVNILTSDNYKLLLWIYSQVYFLNCTINNLDGKLRITFSSFMTQQTFLMIIIFKEIIQNENFFSITQKESKHLCVKKMPILTFDENFI